MTMILQNTITYTQNIGSSKKIHHILKLFIKLIFKQILLKTILLEIKILKTFFRFQGYLLCSMCHPSTAKQLLSAISDAV